MEPSSSEGGGEESILSRMALNDNKAGMQGLDKDKINRIILEVSKGSKFYENELKKERQVNQRIENMLRHKAKITEQQKQKAQIEVAKLSFKLEGRRELGRVIVHVDMDAFYAAVEMRDCPDLKEKPMAVGSMSMLSTSNYQARRYGVRAAMPGFIAKKLCLNLVIVPLNFDKYRAVSEQVREIFADYDPHFLPMSLDEAYLDITEHLEQRQHWPESMRTYYFCEPRTGEEVDKPKDDAGVNTDNLSPLLFDDSPSASHAVPGAKVEVFGTSSEEAVREMRFRIEQKTSLTASAGIAPNMMLAKVCSDKNKPNGQYRIIPERQAVMAFIQNLPVRKVSGIGKVTEKMLAALDIITCSHLGQRMATLSLLFSETSWHHFLQISLGLGSTRIERDSERKSMSTERTFTEMSDADEQYSLCKELCHDLAKDLQKEGMKGKTVTLKIKNVSFEVKTRAFTLQCAVCTEEEIFAVAKDLLKAEIDNVGPEPLRLRLMGVRVSGFISVEDKQPQQKSIMGFLKTASDSTKSSKAEVKSETASVLGSSVDSNKQPCALVAKGMSKPLNWGAYSGGSTELQQQTFFQKAYAKRLQEQSDQEQTPVVRNEHHEDSTVTAKSGLIATTSKATVKTENAQSTQTYETRTKTDTDSPKTNNVLYTTQCLNQQLVAQTQSSNMLQCFTCPVCFNQIKTTDLTSFNQHIDECLSSGVDSKMGLTGLDKQDEVENLLPEYDHALPGSSSMETVNKDLYTQTSKSVETHSCENANFVFKAVNDSGSTALQQTAGSVELIGSPRSTLTCPVCNQVQDTHNLTEFNRHVDMCLNQEVLMELREAVPQRSQSEANLPGKLKDPVRSSNERGKSKRRASSPLPAPKKTKAASSTKHTIDSFFKGNCNQKF
ncbi:DNA polymerase kappa [Trichomycterus rosablanca]|uniref:DNA polymerase kappa n=1 Tax=Trichomycterus rosablanca TaxID=2290929 RepID=UPI002F35FC6C